MVTDRITLNLLRIYLSIVHNTTGVVSDIKISKSTHSGNKSSISKFDTIDKLTGYIDKEAPLTTIFTMQCNPLALYELRSFKILNGDRKIKIISDGRSFKTKSKIGSIIISKLNEYLVKFGKIKQLFDDLDPSSYLDNPEYYVDCMYIQLYFGEALEEVKKLYIKYK
jgi:hypothetical protein